MTDFENVKEELPRKENFCSSLTDRQISNKECEHVINIWTNFEMKTMKDYQDFSLKCDVLLLVDVFETFRNNSFKKLRIMSKLLLGHTRSKLGGNT